MVNEPILQPTMTSIEGAVLAVKIDNLKEQTAGIFVVMEKMQLTLQMLTDVERQQRDFRGALDRSFQEIKVERDRLTKLLESLNLEMPGLRSLRRWVIWLAASAAGMLATALMTLLVINPLYHGYGYQSPSQTIIVPAPEKHE
jgi:hypothetical protein